MTKREAYQAGKRAGRSCTCDIPHVYACASDSEDAECATCPCAAAWDSNDVGGSLSGSWAAGYAAGIKAGVKVRLAQQQPATPTAERGR